jgi:hyperosmotically inducible protein
MRQMTVYGAAAILAGCLVSAPGPASAAVSDAWLTAKTKIALLTTKDVHATGINVDTVNRVVTLHGTVDSAAEKARAAEEARKVAGVREVRNLLQVVPRRQAKAVAASDDEVKGRVAKTLEDDRALEGSKISVASVHDGVVLLEGTADSVSDHLRAIQDASGVPGVRHVESEVKSPDRLADQEIRRQASSQTAGAGRGIGTAARDMWITTDTKMRLITDGRTPATDIDVDTRDGVVTLWGIVPSAAAKTAAEEDARKVSGVSRVVNRLEVVPGSRKEAVKASDDELEKQVRRAIDARDDLQGAKVDVDVKNGVARLSGTVEDDQQRLAAAITARATPGVRAVQDDLHVSAARRPD